MRECSVQSILLADDKQIKDAITVENEMKRIRTVMLFLASGILVAQVATAQMMGGGGSGHHGSSPVPPAGSGNNSGGMNGGGMGGPGMMDGNGMMGRALVVGSDDVVYTLRTTTAAGTTSPSLDVVAIRPAGTIAWATKIDGGTTRLELSGNLLLVASGDDDMGMNGGSGTSERSRLVALSTASGAIQWKLDVDGFPIAMEPFSGGTYVVLAQFDATNDGMHGGRTGTSAMKRSVMAVDNSGKVLWSLDVN